MPNDPEEEPHAEEEAPTTNTTTAMTTEAGTTAPSTTTDPSSKKRKSKKKKRSWLPLESNPEVLSTYARALGAPSSTSFADVYGLDDELLGMVPTPVLALLLLFPITKSYEDRRIAQEKELKQKKKEEEEKSSSSSTSLPFFTRQTIGNACGTVGLIHLFASIKNEMGGGSDEHKDKQVFEPGSFLERFYEATKAMTPDERAAFLEADEEEEDDDEDGESKTQKTSTTEEGGEGEEEDEAKKKDRETRRALAASIDAAHAAGEGCFLRFSFSRSNIYSLSLADDACCCALHAGRGGGGERKSGFATTKKD